MSFEAITEVLKLRVKPSSHKFVLFVYANFANEERQSYPSIDVISEITGLNRKTIILAIRDLVERGILVDTEKRKGATAQIPVYFIDPSAKQFQKRNSSTIGTVPKTEQFQKRTETVPKTVPGYKRDTKDSYSSYSKKNTQNKRDGSFLEKDPYPPGFQAFWKMWPRHPRKNKKASAYERWKKNKLEPRRDEICQVLTAYIESAAWQKENGEYIPAPDVWLNKKCYDDDITDILPASQGKSRIDTPCQHIEFYYSQREDLQRCAKCLKTREEISHAVY